MENGYETRQSGLFFPQRLKIGSWGFPVCNKTVDPSQLSTSAIYCPASGCYCLLKMCVCQHVRRMYGGKGVWPEIKIRDKGHPIRERRPRRAAAERLLRNMQK